MNSLRISAPSAFNLRSLRLNWGIAVRRAQRNAEKKNPLRISANLCASALNLRSLPANRRIAARRSQRKRSGRARSNPFGLHS